MTRPRARWIAPVAALAAGGLFWALSNGGASTSMAAHAFAEVVDHAVAPLQGGRVRRVLVRVGQIVHPGDVVAVMDAREVEIKAQVARSALAEAKAALVAEDIDARAAMARAELLVLKTQTSASKDQAQLTEVRQQLARLEKLAVQQLVQAQDVERVRLLEAQLSASVGMYESANKEHQAGLGRTMRESVTNLQVARRLEPLREVVHQKEDAVRLAELAVDEATIRTRVDGTVSLILHHEGDVVPAATELVRVVSSRPGAVVCWLPERVAGKIGVGRAADLRRLGFFETRFAGQVEEIAPEIEEVPPRARLSPNVPAWGRRVLISSTPDHPLLPGETLHVRFLDRGTGVLSMLLPGDAAAAAPPPVAAFSAQPSSGAAATVEPGLPPQPRPPSSGAAAIVQAPFAPQPPPSPIVVPAALARRSATIEPSGIVWSAALDRYLVVSDDTGSADDHHQPWLLAMNREGSFDDAPVPILGLDALNDAEAIAAGPGGTLFIATSHSPNRRGHVGAARRLLLSTKIEGRALRVTGRLDLTTARDASGGGLLEIARLPAGGRLDIEAVTFRDEALLIGLKSPLSSSGGAVILRLDSPGQAFRAGEIPVGAVTRLWEVSLAGPGDVPRGVADMTALPDGSLVLLANSPKDRPVDHGGAAFWLRPGAAPRLLRWFENLRPEGVTLAADGKSLVVVFDNHDRAPSWTRLALPTVAEAARR